MILSSPLAATKLTIDGFEGFGGNEYPPQVKSSTWRVSVPPISTQEQQELSYKDLELELYTTPQLPSKRLMHYNQIPAAKSYDLIYKDTFTFLSEPQEIDLGTFSAPFLNVCITASFSHKNRDHIEKKRIIISHAAIPLESLSHIEDIRIKLFGMSLLTRTLLLNSQSRYECEAIAEGEIVLSGVEVQERHTFGSWPLSDWITVAFQDARDNKSTPFMKIESINTTIAFSNFRAFLFQGDFSGQIPNFPALQKILQRCEGHFIVELDKEEDFNVPIVDRDKNLNICIVTKQELKLPGLDSQTADFLLYHLGTVTSFLDLKAVTLYLTHAQVGDENGKIDPKAQVTLWEQRQDGIIRPANESTACWNQRSFNH